VRFVFLGSPPFATPILARLLASPNRPTLVVTAPGRPSGRGRNLRESPVERLAAESGVRCLRPGSAREPGFLSELRAFEPDLCFVASFGELLTPEFLDIPRHGSLNVHASLLPRHRGASPVQAALLAGDAVTGVTVQRVVQELDAGDLLLTRETPIGAGETAGELSARLAELGAEAAVEAIERIVDGSGSYRPQDPSGVTTCRRLRKADGRIEWALPAERLERFTRAMHPWPGAQTRLPDGRGLTVLHAEVFRDGRSGRPGTVLEAGKRLVVGAGEDALELLEIQVAGKKAMRAEAFLRGARLSPGESMNPKEV